MEEQDQNEKKTWLTPEIEDLDSKETNGGTRPMWTEGVFVGTLS